MSESSLCQLPSRTMRNLIILLFGVLSLSSSLHSASVIKKRMEQAGHPYCGTYPGRIEDELRKAKDLRRLIEGHKRTFNLARVIGATRDVGQIAVIEDDGSIIL